MSSAIPDCCVSAPEAGCPIHPSILTRTSTLDLTNERYEDAYERNWDEIRDNHQDFEFAASSSSTGPRLGRNLLPIVHASQNPPPSDVSSRTGHLSNVETSNSGATTVTTGTTATRSRKRKAINADEATGSASSAAQPASKRRGKVARTTAVVDPSATSVTPAPPRLPPAQSNPSSSGFQALLAKKKSRPTTAASDVWFFMRPLPSKLKPTDPPTPFSGPFLMEKPSESDFPAIGCRLCRWDTWKAWKNTDGQVPGIRAHLESHSEWAVQVIQHKLAGWQDLVEKLRRKDEPEREPFTLDGFLRRLTAFIVVDDQAINLVECVEFRDLLLYVSPYLSEKSIPHRTRAMALVVQGFKDCYSDLIERIRCSEGKVSFTSDIWEDTDRRAFMSVTAHFIVRRNNQLVLETQLIALRHIIGRHTGATLAIYLREILREAGVLHKVGHFTLDNASNCDTTIRELVQELKKELAEEDGILDFDGEDKRVRCFAHVINLAVQDALKTLHQVDHLNISLPPATMLLGHPSDTDTRPSPSSYVAALKSDILKKTRDLVTACRSSGQRRQNLKSSIEQANAEGLLNPAITPLQLMTDMEVRWSSTYFMIQRLLYPYPALRNWLQQPEQTELRAKHEFSDIDIYVLNDIKKLLKQFHSVQESLSMECTPTLCFVIVAYEGLILHLKKRMGSRSGIGIMHAYEAAIRKVEQYLVKCSENPVYALAVILNPRTKLGYIRENWTTERYTQARTQVLTEMIRKQSIRELTTTANGNARPSPPPPPMFPASSSDGGYDDDDSPWAIMYRRAGLGSRTVSVAPVAIAELEEAREQRHREVVEEELRLYEDEMVRDYDLGNGGLLKYWEKREHEFPNLFKIAMDILPVQATSVPSERIFSAAGRTMSKDRNRITPQHFEILQIYKYYLRSKRVSFVSDWTMAEREILIANLEDDIEGPMNDMQLQEVLELLAELE